MSSLRRYGKIGSKTGSIISSDGAWQLPYKIVSPAEPTERLSPILLIQGWTGQANDWGTFPQVLAASTARPVVLFDQRAVGKSELCSCSVLREISLNDLTADAVGVAEKAMETIGARSIVPFGFSFGGVVAQSMAESGFGRNIQTTILCSSWRQLDPDLFNKDFLTCFDDWGRYSQHAARHFFRRGLTEALVDSKPNYVEKLAENFVVTRGELFAESVKLQKQCLLSEYGLREGYEGDCLLLHGDSDRAVYPRSSERMKLTTLGQAELKLLRGCGHFVWSFHAMEACTAVSEYLQNKP